MRWLRGVIWAMIILAAANLVLPFVGPLFGFGMGPTEAFEITESRVTRHVIPNAAVIIGGLLMLSSVSARRWVGGILAVLGGAWVATGPHLLQVESVSQFFKRVTYHSATGIALVVLASFALGVLAARRYAGLPRVATTELEDDTRAPVGA